MFDAALSPQQLQIIHALSDGMSSTDAAAQAGVHRNTIANWRRNSLFFREALADAQYDRALLFRDKTEEKLDLALKTLDSVLSDPKASASARLKAALFIIEKAITPPQPKKQVALDISEVHVSAPAVPPAPPQTTVENPPSVHSPAQTKNLCRCRGPA